MFEEDKEYQYFIKWWTEQERRFHCGCFGDSDKGYASFLEGMKFAIDNYEKGIKKDNSFAR